MKNLPLLLTFALAPQVGADLVISEVDLATGQVEIVNTGDASVDMTSYRWCNRVNGAPSFYPGVSAATINEALSTASSLDVGPGQLLVFDLPVTFLPATGGELGLYLPSAAGGFGSRNAMVDYVNWGDSTGVRDSAADDDPAIWETNAAIDVSGAGELDRIKQLVRRHERQRDRSQGDGP